MFEEPGLPNDALQPPTLIRAKPPSVIPADERPDQLTPLRIPREALQHGPRTVTLNALEDFVRLFRIQCVGECDMCVEDRLDDGAQDRGCERSEREVVGGRGGHRCARSVRWGGRVAPSFSQLQ